MSTEKEPLVETKKITKAGGYYAMVLPVDFRNRHKLENHSKIITLEGHGIIVMFTEEFNRTLSYKDIVERVLSVLVTLKEKFGVVKEEDSFEDTPEFQELLSQLGYIKLSASIARYTCINCGAKFIANGFHISVDGNDKEACSEGCITEYSKMHSKETVILIENL